MLKSGLSNVRTKTPELPDNKYKRYLSLDVRPYDANIIAFDIDLANFFDGTLKTYIGKAQTIANWLNSDVVGWLKGENLSLKDAKLKPEG